MKFKAIPLVLLLATLMLLLGGCGKDMPPEVVYSKFNPAVALITTAAGHGTGVIIDEGNYVLTAYHIVDG